MSRRRRPHHPTDRLRVGFLTPGLGVGGAERWVVSLAKHFAPSIEVAGIWTPDTSGPLAAEARRTCPVHLISSTPADYDMFGDLDVLIAWGCQHLAGHTRYFRGRIIAVSHGCPDLEWTRQICADMEATQRLELVAVSEAAAASWSRPSTVIYNGAEPGRCAPRRTREEVRRSLCLQPRNRMALFFGRLSAEKRPALLAEACALAGHWVGVFCGPDSGAAPELLGMSHAVVLPPRDEPGDMLAAADVFVLPSVTEGFPLAVTEAWLASVPVVATRLPWLLGVEAAVGMELARKVTPDGTASDWAQAISRSSVVHDTASVRDIAWHHFTAGAMAQRWEDYLFHHHQPSPPL